MFNMDISETPKAAAETANEETGDHANLEDMVSTLKSKLIGQLYTNIQLNPPRKLSQF